MDRPLRTTGQPWRAMTRWSKVPPSVVLMLAPAVTLPFKPDPTAVQSAVEKQVIDSNPVIPTERSGSTRCSLHRSKRGLYFRQQQSTQTRTGRTTSNSPPLTEIGSVATPELVPPSVVTISPNGSCDGNAIGGVARNVPHKCESGRRRPIGPRRSAVHRSHYPTLTVLAFSNGKTVCTRRARNTGKSRVSRIARADSPLRGCGGCRVGPLEAAGTTAGDRRFPPRKRRPEPPGEFFQAVAS